MKYLYLLITFFLLCSCTSTKKNKITRLLKEWDSKVIKFPAKSVFTIQGKDTITDLLSNRYEYKIVTYIDSIGCIGCKLQLPRWVDYMNQIDSLTKRRVSFLFYFYSKNVNELNYILKRDQFSYPICLDKKDELNQLNRFPHEMAFQTFLLDKKNKVIAIGNPIHNYRIRELFLNIILGKQVVKENKLNTMVCIEKDKIDFGEIELGKKAVHNIDITNMGRNLFVIHEVSSSCGCLKVKYDKRPIRFKEKLKMSVTYDADKVGVFRKRIMIYCNANNTHPLAELES